MLFAVEPLYGNVLLTCIRKQTAFAVITFIRLRQVSFCWDLTECRSTLVAEHSANRCAETWLRGCRSVSHLGGLQEGRRQAPCEKGLVLLIRPLLHIGSRREALIVLSGSAELLKGWCMSVCVLDRCATWHQSLVIFLLMLLKFVGYVESKQVAWQTKTDGQRNHKLLFGCISMCSCVREYPSQSSALQSALIG